MIGPWWMVSSAVSYISDHREELKQLSKRKGRIRIKEWSVSPPE
jgi:hypothetical protein